jgi:hypothetical protein
MHTRILAGTIVLLSGLSTSGCMHANAYIEDGYGQVSAPPLRRPDSPQPVRLETAFRVNGQLRPEVNPTLTADVGRALHDSGVMLPVDGNAAMLLKVVVEDRVDLGQARKEGFIQGFSRGKSGDAVEDRYDFTLTLENLSGVVLSHSYQPVMASSASQVPSSYGEPYSSSDEAFYIIVRATVLSFLADWQSQ